MYENSDPPYILWEQEEVNNIFEKGNIIIAHNICAIHYAKEMYAVAVSCWLTYSAQVLVNQTKKGKSETI